MLPFAVLLWLRQRQCFALCHFERLLYGTDVTETKARFWHRGTRRTKDSVGPCLEKFSRLEKLALVLAVMGPRRQLSKPRPRH